MALCGFLFLPLVWQELPVQETHFVRKDIQQPCIHLLFIVLGFTLLLIGHYPVELAEEKLRVEVL